MRYSETLLIAGLFLLMLFPSSAQNNEVENITLELEFSSGNDVYVDGQSVSEGFHKAENIDYAYIVSDQPVGIVSYGELNSINYSTEGSNDVFRVEQTESTFLVPNTGDSYIEIEDDEEGIEDRSFLNNYNPSFAFPELESPVVRVILDPIVETKGFEQRLKRSFDFYVRHMVDDKTEPVVEIGPN